MSARSGELAGGNFTRIGVEELVRETLAELRADISVEAAPGLEIIGPRVALTQALSNLLRNALHASTRVMLKTERRDSRLLLRVEDEGPSLSDDVLARLGEPFFTTRPTGQGLGLGVFLARTLADQLGGSLRYERGATRGTVAVMELPLA
jgi:two-component system sensor histidine kinase RegB